MSNVGVVPVDVTTDVGMVRLQVGDTNYSPLVPPESGFGDYDYLSDEEILQLLEVSSGSITRATGYSYRKIAAELTLSAVNITTDDLRISTVDRAKQFRELANDWLSSADAEDLAAGADIFDVVPFAGFDSSYIPEGTPYPLIGRRVC